MKKFILTLITIVFISCEKDDFCIQNPVTPNLILRFYDKDEQTQLKNVQRLSLIAEGKTDSLFTNQTTDSIAIPLNSLENKTVYTLKMNTIDGNENNNEIATLTIQYDTKDDFVSRSCGFRVLFNDLNLTHTNWINTLSTSQITNIENQTKAHVQVFH